ncbi:MAG TPA: hypothetical protein VFX22_11725 [Candidatus Kapabacteria bacterium]|nr:hypothetical protein [Candidatus Kapabacteria bacterium]
MIETTDPNIHPVDSLIERTLARDAESTRKRFAAIPNAQLTAKLALSTASRGLFSGLGAKLALYAGGALLIGSAAYFIPSMRQQSAPMIAPAMTTAPAKTTAPMTTIAPATPPAKSATVQHSSTIASIPSKTEVAKTVTTRSVPEAESASAPLKLDEGDGKNIPHITNPKYEGPLK